MNNKIKKIINMVLILTMILPFLHTTKVQAAVKMNESSVEMEIGSTKTIKLKGNKKVVKWSVSDETIAMLYTSANQAKIIALKSGEAYLNATVGKKTYKCLVTVKTSEFSIENLEEEKLLYEDDNIKIYYQGIVDDGEEYYIKLFIENLSDKTLEIQVSETSVNGMMVDTSFSEEVSPEKKAIGKIRIHYDYADLIPMNAFESMETKFSIFDQDDTFLYDTDMITIKR